MSHERNRRALRLARVCALEAEGVPPGRAKHARDSRDYFVACLASVGVDAFVVYPDLVRAKRCVVASRMTACVENRRVWYRDLRRRGLKAEQAMRGSSGSARYAATVRAIEAGEMLP